MKSEPVVVAHTDEILVEREILTDGSPVFNLIIAGCGGHRLARLRTNCSEKDAAFLAGLLADRIISVEPCA